MERNIIVKDMSTNSTYRYNGVFSTLQDVLTKLAENSVSTDNKEFIVAGANITLRDATSQLPESITFNGTERKDLIIVASNITKKMTLGSYTRAEIYSIIKRNNLQEAIKAEFGDNFTRIASEDLINFCYEEGVLGSDNDIDDECDCDICQVEKAMREEEGTVNELDALKEAFLKTTVCFAALKAIVANLGDIYEELRNKMQDTPNVTGKIPTNEGEYSADEVEEMLTSL